MRALPVQPKPIQLPSVVKSATVECKRCEFLLVATNQADTATAELLSQVSNHPLLLPRQETTDSSKQASSNLKQLCIPDTHTRLEIDS